MTRTVGDLLDFESIEAVDEVPAGASGGETYRELRECLRELESGARVRMRVIDQATPEATKKWLDATQSAIGNFARKEGVELRTRKQREGDVLFLYIEHRGPRASE